MSAICKAWSITPTIRGIWNIPVTNLWESFGENFGRMHEAGIDAFVSKVEIRFRHSLKSGDRFLSCLNLKREGVKLVFDQDIYHLPDNVLTSSGRVETVIVEDGKLTRGDYFDDFLEKVNKK